MKTTTFAFLALCAGLSHAGAPGVRAAQQQRADAVGQIDSRPARPLTPPGVGLDLGPTSATGTDILTDVLNETNQLNPSDGASADQFGRRVGISGNAVVVGSHADSGVIPNPDDPTAPPLCPAPCLFAGSAYIYDRDLGGVANWGERKKLQASNPQPNDQFGVSVAIDANTAVVGAFAKFGVSGAAYVFRRNMGGTNNWGEVRMIRHADPISGDWFGYSSAISGDTAIIGAKNKAFGAALFAGAAYVFDRNQGGASNWGQVAKLTAPAADANQNDQFGASVSISGDLAVVGALADSGRGAAYVFQRNLGGANAWGLVKKLVASDAAPSDLFGWSVGISGETVVVGALAKCLMPQVPCAKQNLFAGAAYIFERNEGGADNWGEVVKLVASDAATNDQFGIAVAISGGAAVVGSFADDDAGHDSGSAYVYLRDEGGANNWGEFEKLLASDAVAEDWFGSSVAASQATAIVGAPFNNLPGVGPKPPGSAYLFALPGESSFRLFIGDASAPGSSLPAHHSDLIEASGATRLARLAGR